MSFLFGRRFDFFCDMVVGTTLFYLKDAKLLDLDDLSVTYKPGAQLKTVTATVTVGGIVIAALIHNSSCSRETLENMCPDTLDTVKRAACAVNFRFRCG